jgi:predicted RNase H-like HicB family nuclease
MKYVVIYERTGNGYSAYIPDLPGCIAAGKTLAQTKRLIRSACEMHLEAMRRDGDPIPEPTSLSDFVEVA